MLDRLTGMQVFLRTASKGTLAAAARELGLSAAMATKHLNALETRLGVRLFRRTTRKLTLTEAGQVYEEALGRLLPALSEVEAAVASQRVEVSGTLRLNAPTLFGARYLAPLFPEFLAANPNVLVDLGLSDRIVDVVDEGWDLAIRFGPLRDSRLLSRKLGDCAMLVCASPDYWDANGRPSQLADLSTLNCLRFASSAVSAGSTWRFGRDRSISQTVEGTLVANNGDALKEASIAGLGVSYLPEYIAADAIRSGKLEAIVLDVSAATLGGIHVIYPSDRMPPAKVRAMIDFLVAQFTPTAPWHRVGASASVAVSRGDR